ncbi:MAG: hypothetical protein HPY66_0112 [Firmicutes bacterium]|nr:hypothetical protein [Bacillota bacterium]MDI6706549.1 hypothetical protein [Bacillota bacterium]
MGTEFKECILAVVTTNRDKVLGSAAPVFFAENDEERERVSLLIGKATKGMVHDLENGCYIIVKH